MVDYNSPMGNTRALSEWLRDRYGHDISGAPEVLRTEAHSERALQHKCPLPGDMPDRENACYAFRRLHFYRDDAAHKVYYGNSELWTTGAGISDNERSTGIRPVGPDDEREGWAFVSRFKRA